MGAKEAAKELRAAFDCTDRASLTAGLKRLRCGVIDEALLALDQKAQRDVVAREQPPEPSRANSLLRAINDAVQGMKIAPNSDRDRDLVFKALECGWTAEMFERALDDRLEKPKPDFERAMKWVEEARASAAYLTCSAHELAERDNLLAVMRAVLDAVVPALQECQRTGHLYDEHLKWTDRAAAADLLRKLGCKTD